MSKCDAVRDYLLNPGSIIAIILHWYVSLNQVYSVRYGTQ